MIKEKSYTTDDQINSAGVRLATEPFDTANFALPSLPSKAKETLTNSKNLCFPPKVN